MDKEIKPQPVQELFLSTEADVCFFGGGAGGGKTWSLLVEPLRHANVAGFNSLTFRRSAVEIRSPGGLWDASRNLYSQLDGDIKPIPREQQLDWKFKSGAMIKFAHLMNDATRYEYQGTEICLLCFDEICHFSFVQFTYLLSRNRSTCGVKPYVRATCNPDKDSWVRNFIDWWVGEDGLIIPERAGVIRYFYINDIDTIWADTEEELLPYYSQLELDAGARPRSFTFIPANIYDNEILLHQDPNYISSLKSQNKIDRERLLGCNWNISLSDYGVVLTRHDFSRYSLSEKMKIPGFFSESYFVLDGASRTSEANDYSVLGLWARGKFDQQWYIIDWLRIRLQEPDLEQAIIDKWHYWRDVRYNNTIIFTPKGVNIERGACGIGMMQRLPRKAIPCFELEPIKDKFYRLNDGLGIIKSKWVNVPDDAAWANTFFEECECFRADMKHVLMAGEIKPHDDQIDNMAYAISSQVNQKAAIEVYKKPQQQKPRHGLWLNN